MNHIHPCYFCKELMIPEIGNNFLRCMKHEGWVYHHYDESETMLLKVYFAVKKGNVDRYGFVLRLSPRTTVVSFLYYNDLMTTSYKDIIRFNCIPDNLTPETATEKLSFYLTYM